MNSEGMKRRVAWGLALCALVLLGVACTSGVRISTALFSPVEAPIELAPDEPSARDLHKALFDEERYPSARTCARCHEDHYEEWRVSPHAYAQLSPVFNAMHGTIVKETNGTFGDFCIRCHTPVGMNLNEPVFASNLNRHPTSREGITCIVCHRIDRSYGKVSGRFDVVEGDIVDPVYGPSGGDELKRVLKDEEGIFGTLASKKGATGNKIHSDVVPFFQLAEPGFCGTCHDVTLGNGFRLEEAFSDYKSSPAAKAGVSCQDCHMGTKPGVPSEYAFLPAAKINGQYTEPRKRTNHMFAGPDYSIVHPGLFPHLGETDYKLANMSEWLKFDYEAKWGSKEFEDSYRALGKALKSEGREDEIPVFPEPWDSRSNRKKASKIIESQHELLAKYADAQLAVLRAGYVMGDIVLDEWNSDGLAFHVEVKNGTDGHEVPTGFIAERSLFLEVTVTDSEGAVVFQSGDTDPNGDIRDTHSLYVHNGELPLDEQLYSLQSQFIVRLARGGEREQVLAINHSADPLPFLRPSTTSTIITGRPTGARIHRKTLQPRESRPANYLISAEDLSGKPPYAARVRMISGMVPPNLIDEIQHVGFDYGLSAREVADRIVEGRRVLWDKEVLFEEE